MSNSGRPCYTDFEDEDINVTENNKAEIVEEISGHVNGDHLLDHEQTEGNENVDDVQAQKPVLEAVEIEQDEELQNPVTAALIDVLEEEHNENDPPILAEILTAGDVVSPETQENHTTAATEISDSFISTDELNSTLERNSEELAYTEQPTLPSSDDQPLISHASDIETSTDPITTTTFVEMPELKQDNDTTHSEELNDKPLLKFVSAMKEKFDKPNSAPVLPLYSRPAPRLSKGDLIENQLPEDDVKVSSSLVFDSRLSKDSSSSLIPSHARNSSDIFTILEPGGDVVYSYQDLKSAECPPTVDKQRKEEYLNEEEFVTVFKMSKEEFAILPKWRRLNKKKEVGLF